MAPAKKNTSHSSGTSSSKQKATAAPEDPHQPDEKQGAELTGEDSTALTEGDEPSAQSTQKDAQLPKPGADGSGQPAKAASSKTAAEEPEILKRHVDQEFREILGKGLAACRRNMVTVGIFSFGVNLLVLAIPIYLFNISDRVLTSRSQDTLIMLTAVVLGAVLMHALLDMMRRFSALQPRQLKTAPAVSSRYSPTCSTCATSSPGRCCSLCLMHRRFPFTCCVCSSYTHTWDSLWWPRVLPF